MTRLEAILRGLLSMGGMQVAYPVQNWSLAHRGGWGQTGSLEVFRIWVQKLLVKHIPMYFLFLENVVFFSSQSLYLMRPCQEAEHKLEGKRTPREREALDRGDFLGSRKGPRELHETRRRHLMGRWKQVQGILVSSAHPCPQGWAPGGGNTERVGRGALAPREKLEASEALWSHATVTLRSVGALSQPWGTGCFLLCFTVAQHTDACLTSRRYLCEWLLNWDA